MRALMIQGTGSSVGKSVIVAGLARALTLRGLAVRPFKPQNMSNNAAVTQEGGEIGRAQALQARACKVAPSLHMNPVLLKPQSEIGAQLVVRGAVRGNYRARDYQALKPSLLGVVLESFAHLRNQADIVLVEGAGSASETNLRAGDIANMGFARATGTPVVLLGDIDRGGVIASLVGTQCVLDPQDAALIKGFIVNRMRGDLSLFDAGMRTIAERTGWAPLGLVPFLEAVRALPAEDAADLALTYGAGTARGAGGLHIAVPLLPGIANFDDLDPLAAEPGVQLSLIVPGQPLPAPCALIILPGSKTTIADLAALRAQGWDIDLRAHVRRGGRVLGLCGGYQMLGTTIADPHGSEGPAGAVEGLGLLDVRTVLEPGKRLACVRGRLAEEGAPVEGFEMHMGLTTGPAALRPMLHLEDAGRTWLDGAVSDDGRIMGTYLHGLFGSDAGRRALLLRLGLATPPRDHGRDVETALDSLAAHLERHVDIPRLLQLAR